MNMPAIVDFHRVNISGTFDEQRRTNGLTELGKFFDIVKKEHPDALFLSTPELSNLLDHS
jgi:hypothetical protein